ncbi:hypothetical protein STCU_11074 [Strigomonas culicis]|uniref:Uncharacterized protein n=1 Tax=Strigomonas culicis TaxID=28005 RepID=S9TIG9_9TRYP|nr:hypothetical protein STCU_11074 [Strigomonas culicis]|eukprot:EPY16664.1 hypothetical protein STCU_11074 [Strigomonas culicis]
MWLCGPGEASGGKGKEVEAIKRGAHLKKKEMQDSKNEEENEASQKEYENLVSNMSEKEKEMRVEALLFLSSRMCNTCKLNFRSRRYLSGNTKTYQMRGKCFETTFCVLDDVLNTSALLRVITSTFDGSFLDALNKLSMEIFFGTIYIVCCCRDTRSSISYSESPLQRYWAIDMHPSDTLV